MAVEKSTLVSNKVLDEWLPKLNLIELKVLLVIIRQTVGWKKDKDWISISQFEKKTGLSRKSISQAIQCLIERQLIVATDERGLSLNKSKQRRGNKRIFYSCTLAKCSHFPKTSVKSTLNMGSFFPKHGKNLPITKDTLTNNCRGKNVHRLEAEQNRTENMNAYGNIRVIKGRAVFIQS